MLNQAHAVARLARASDLPHQARRDRKEVRAIVECHPIGVDEA
jgi:hypothetical protein